MAPVREPPALAGMSLRPCTQAAAGTGTCSRPLADHPGEGHDVHFAHARCPERRRCCRGRGTGRVDVVDERDCERWTAGRRRRRCECIPDVPATLDPREPGLTRDVARASEQRPGLEVPAQRQLVRESLRRLMAALQAAITVGRDIGDDVDRRRGHCLGHELGGQSNKRAEAALLPCMHERAADTVVGDRSAGGGERQAPPRALDAALDRPGCGRTAPSTQRGPKKGERAPAGLAQEPRRSARPRKPVARGRRFGMRRRQFGQLRAGGGTATAGATRWKEKVDEPHRRRYGRRCDMSVAASFQNCNRTPSSGRTRPPGR